MTDHNVIETKESSFISKTGSNYTKSRKGTDKSGKFHVINNSKDLDSKNNRSAENSKKEKISFWRSKQSVDRPSIGSNASYAYPSEKDSNFYNNQAS